MSDRREALVSAVALGRAGALAAAVLATPDVSECVLSLSRKQCVALWSGVASLVANAQTSQDDGRSKILPEYAGDIQAAAALVRAAISPEKPAATDELVRAVHALHDVILSFDAESPAQAAAQSTVAEACEAWWLSQTLPGRDEVVPQTITYILARSIGEGVKAADVKRASALREGLHVLAIDDESCAVLRAMLLRCAIHPAHVKSDDGRKLIAQLFALSQGMSAHVHAAIKLQLPSASTGLVDCYADVYFRAWKLLPEGPAASFFETHCVQDLLFRAVHARSDIKCRLAPLLLRLVAGAFHAQKKVRGMDAMLLRLYDPILWRALRVANPAVRANAAALFLDAFPLVNPEATREDTDALLQRQFDALADLLADEHPGVRAVAARGCARVLSAYWELIPAPAVRVFLERLLDLAFDASAPAVREGALDGVGFLLDNALAQDVLVPVLPRLGALIHDVSEKVRAALVGLLLKAKGIHAVRFWKITPLDEILARLACDDGVVARRIVALLANSYFPQGKSADEQLSRCVAMVRANPAAAAKFYALLRREVSAGTVVKFSGTVVLAIHEAFRKAHTKPAAHPKAAKGARKRMAAGDLEREAAAEAAVAEGVPVDADGISADDPDTLSGVVCVVTAMIGSVMSYLAKDRFVKMRERTAGAVRAVVGPLMAAFPEGQGRMCVLRLASLFPPSEEGGAVPREAQDALNRALAMGNSLTRESRLAMVDCAFAWGFQNRVYEAVLAWLGASLGGSKARRNRVDEAEDVLVDSDAEDVAARGRGGRKGARGKENEGVASRSKVSPPEAAATQLDLAVLVMGHVLGSASHRAAFLAQPEVVQAVVDSIFKVHGVIEAAVAGGPSSHSPESVASALSLYASIMLHAHAASQGDKPAVPPAVELIMEWCDAILVPAVVAAPKSGAPAHPVRNARKAASPTSESLAVTCLESIAGCVADACAVGMMEYATVDRFARIARAALQSPCGYVLVRPLLRVAFHAAFLGADTVLADPVVQAILVSVARRIPTAPPTEVESLQKSFSVALTGLAGVYGRKGAMETLAAPLAAFAIEQMSDCKAALDCLPLAVDELPATVRVLLPSMSGKSGAAMCGALIHQVAQLAIVGATGAADAVRILCCAAQETLRECKQFIAHLEPVCARIADAAEGAECTPLAQETLAMLRQRALEPVAKKAPKRQTQDMHTPVKVPKTPSKKTAPAPIAMEPPQNQSSPVVVTPKGRRGRGAKRKVTALRSPMPASPSPAPEMEESVRTPGVTPKPKRQRRGKKAVPLAEIVPPQPTIDAPGPAMAPKAVVADDLLDDASEMDVSVMVRPTQGKFRPTAEAPADLLLDDDDDTHATAGVKDTATKRNDVSAAKQPRGRAPGGPRRAKGRLNKATQPPGAGGKKASTAVVAPMDDSDGIDF